MSPTKKMEKRKKNSLTYSYKSQKRDRRSISGGGIPSSFFSSQRTLLNQVVAACRRRRSFFFFSRGPPGDNIHIHTQRSTEQRKAQRTAIHIPPYRMEKNSGPGCCFIVLGLFLVKRKVNDRLLERWNAIAIRFYDGKINSIFQTKEYVHKIK